MMARGKNKIAMLVACTLLVGCASSPNATDASKTIYYNFSKTETRYVEK